MLDKLRKLAFELEGAILIVLIGIQFVAVPATYALCLAAATDWTWSTSSRVSWAMRSPLSVGPCIGPC